MGLWKKDKILKAIQKKEIAKAVKELEAAYPDPADQEAYLEKTLGQKGTLQFYFDVYLLSPGEEQQTHPSKEYLRYLAYWGKIADPRKYIDIAEAYAKYDEDEECYHLALQWGRKALHEGKDNGDRAVDLFLNLDADIEDMYEDDFYE